ncbi:neutral alpha-glucosidase C-like [Corythoichthys intestinalis]|uniref:neutral alpha-glucosidase C-like n=1 Tax=Corythoichthys intestinalis TaxID=161448 RepID=UPI0025A603C3|nr:neutral alpha-glucosidase C-like [Corythoichthys intestinalis]
MMDVKQPNPSGVPSCDNKHKFMKSHQVGFYRRQTQGPKMQYQAILDTLVLTEKGACFELLEPNKQNMLYVSVSPCKNDTVRIVIDELKPIKPRYRVPDVLTQEPKCEMVRLEERQADSVTLSWTSGLYRCRVWQLPFRLELLCDDQAVVTFNAQSKLWFETLRERPQEAEGDTSELDKDNLWRETFRDFVDIKANGPTSIGADLRLHGFQDVFGIPEHSDSLRLADTRDDEPYRLYNLDVYAYEIHSHLGIYGSVPLLMAHKEDRTLGVFWLNASDSFVHINYSQEEDGPLPHTDVHWLSESGVIDCMVLLGPSPAQMYRQYAELTGYQTLPPLFTLGYHHSRWDKDSQEDVAEVDAGFDRHHIPYDVMWLDIEHTDEKRFFTWNPKLFPDPAKLQCYLEKKNRKLVVIVDPPIMVDPDWSLYQEGRGGEHFIMDREGQIYQGKCWPGNSHFPDFSSPHTRAWYAKCFALDRYKGSTPSLHVWLDLNEPTVFYGPEESLPKDTVQFGGWEHRELHNLYGFYQHMAAVDGLKTRSGGSERPFVLSRAFFAGTQRLGAVWTGDNLSTWEYLRISIPMCLSMCVTGISFCGSDIGGFFPEPSPELLVRWYQAACLQPFFRGHSSMNAKRREPWLFEEDVTKAIRSVIQERYRLLPYWYTLFYRAHTNGLPVLRPLWIEFPHDKSLFSMEHQYMLGEALLVCPITESGVTKLEVLFPGAGQLWYDVKSTEVHQGGMTSIFPVSLDTIPVFQRGGTIVCRAVAIGTCTADLQKTPLALTVALDVQGAAKGEVYMDDGHSFSYRDKKEFCLRSFCMLAGHLQCRTSGEAGIYKCGIAVHSVDILGMRGEPSEVKVYMEGRDEGISLEFEYHLERCHICISNLELSLDDDWDIQIC